MATPKNPSQKTKKSSPEETSAAHYHAILVEDLRSQFKAVIEHVEGFRESIEGKFTTLEGKVTRLEGKVTHLTDQVIMLDSKVTTLDSKVTTLDSKVTTLDSKVTTLDSKVTTLSNDMHGVQQYLKKNETRWQENEAWQQEAMHCLSRIENKVDNHEDRITTIEHRSPNGVY